MRRHLLALVLALALLAVVVVGRSLAGKATHTVTISSGPSGTVASTDADFTFASSATATSPARSTALLRRSAAPEGRGKPATEASLQARTASPSSRPSPRAPDTARDDRSWTVAPSPQPADTTPPETTIDSAVAGPVLADGAALPLSLGTVPLNIATFTFSANESGRFTCSLDRRDFACTSPLRNAHLAAGVHRFEARAIDVAGNVDPTPATHAFSGAVDQGACNSIGSSPGPPPVCPGTKYRR